MSKAVIKQQLFDLTPIPHEEVIIANILQPNVAENLSQHRQSRHTDQFETRSQTDLVNAIRKVGLDGRETLNYVACHFPTLGDIFQTIQQDEGRIFAFFPTLNNLLNIFEQDSVSESVNNNVSHIRTLNLPEAHWQLDWHSDLAESLDVVIMVFADVVGDIEFTIGESSSQTKLTDLHFMVADILIPILGTWASGHAAASVWSTFVSDPRKSNLTQGIEAPPDFQEWILKAASNKFLSFFVKAGRNKNPEITNRKELSGRMGTTFAFLTLLESLPAWIFDSGSFESLRFFRENSDAIRGYTFASKVFQGDPLAARILKESMTVGWKLGRKQVIGWGSGLMIEDGLKEGYYLATFQAALTAILNNATGTHYGGKGGSIVRERLQHAANIISIFEPINIVYNGARQHWAELQGFPSIQVIDRIDILQSLAYMANPGNAPLPVLKLTEQNTAEAYLRRLLGFSELDPGTWNATFLSLLVELRVSLTNEEDTALSETDAIFLRNQILQNALWVSEVKAGDWQFFIAERIEAAMRWSPRIFKEFYCSKGKRLPLVKAQFAPLVALARNPTAWRNQFVTEFAKQQHRLQIIQALAYVFAVDKPPLLNAAQQTDVDDWLREYLGCAYDTADRWMDRKADLMHQAYCRITNTAQEAAPSNTFDTLNPRLLTAVKRMLIDAIQPTSTSAEQVKVFQRAANATGKFPPEHYREFYIQTFNSSAQEVSRSGRLRRKIPKTDADFLAKIKQAIEADERRIRSSSELHTSTDETVDDT